jgi:hypothetical protein
MTAGAAPYHRTGSSIICGNWVRACVKDLVGGPILIN